MGVELRVDGENEKWSEVVGDGKRLKILELFAEIEKADRILGASFLQECSLRVPTMYYNFLSKKMYHN